jgi:hypothetical protein
VITVAFSSNALIAYENNLQAESIQKKIGQMSQTSLLRKSDYRVSPPPDSITPPTVNDPVAVVKNTPIVANPVISPKKDITVPTRKYEREEEGEDD